MNSERGSRQQCELYLHSYILTLLSLLDLSAAAAPLVVVPPLLFVRLISSILPFSLPLVPSHPISSCPVLPVSRARCTANHSDRPVVRVLNAFAFFLDPRRIEVETPARTAFKPHSFLPSQSPLLGSALCLLFGVTLGSRRYRRRRRLHHGLLAHSHADALRDDKVSALATLPIHPFPEVQSHCPLYSKYTPRPLPEVHHTPRTPLLYHPSLRRVRHRDTPTPTGSLARRPRARARARARATSEANPA